MPLMTSFMYDCDKYTIVIIVHKSARLIVLLGKIEECVSSFVGSYFHLNSTFQRSFGQQHLTDKLIPLTHSPLWVI